MWSIVLPKTCLNIMSSYEEWMVCWPGIKSVKFLEDSSASKVDSVIKLENLGWSKTQINGSTIWDFTQCLNKYLPLKTFPKEANVILLNWEKPLRKSNIWAWLRNLMLSQATNCYNTLVGFITLFLSFPKWFKIVFLLHEFKLILLWLLFLDSEHP